MIRSLLAACALASLALTTAQPSSASVLADWPTIAVPAPPAAAPVSVDPATTAFLVLDVVKQLCNFPRCTAIVPNVARLLAKARAAHALVVYSYVTNTGAADNMAQVSPLGGEPSVQSHADKFVNTDLQQILASKGIKTVIVSGIAANGAPLYTGSHAAFLNFDVVVPVDAIAAPAAFDELVAVWNLTHAPGVANHAKLTTVDQLTFTP